jgi:hypothetical protein
MMKITGWKKLFAPHILSRGEEYFESELVNIEKIDEQSVAATVEGTDVYSVEIVLKNDRVADMYCDCPYAADGNNCKHMAAVLFVAEEENGGNSNSEDNSQYERKKETADANLENTIAGLSDAQLRQLLTDTAKTHSDVRDRIAIIGKKTVDPALKKRWASDLRKISRSASDRSGFIDYYHAYDYFSELEGYMGDTIEPLLENRLIMDAFDLVGLVFIEAMSQEVDDSDGGLTLIASECNDYWEKLTTAPEADQVKMLDWFQTQLHRFSGDVGEDFLLPVIFGYFTDPKLLPKIIKMLDKEIEAANEYSVERLVCYRVDLMRKLGASENEINVYRKKFWAYPFIRKQELDCLESEKRWEDALKLLNECEKMDSDNQYLMSQYNLRRIQIFKQCGQKDAWLEELKRHIFSFPQRDMTYITELKRAVSTEQWQEILPQLFNNENTKELRRQLQLSEGMLEQMMIEFETSRFPYELKQYEKDLRKVFPERVRDLLLKQVDQQMRYASERKAYATAVRELKHLYGYPDGRARAAELAKTWRNDYPRRTAMLEELKKAKL